MTRIPTSSDMGCEVIELVHHLKRWRTHVPVIVLGADSTVPLAVRVMRAGRWTSSRNPSLSTRCARVWTE